MTTLEAELRAEAEWLLQSFGYDFDDLFPADGISARNGRGRCKSPRYQTRCAVAYYLRSIKTKTFAEQPTYDMIASVLRVDETTASNWARAAVVRGKAKSFAQSTICVAKPQTVE